MAALVRMPLIWVTLNGVQLFGNSAPLSAMCAVGLDQQTSTATIRIAQLPNPAAPPQPLLTVVELFMDAPVMVGSTPGAYIATTMRFKGFLTELDYALWPRSIDLICRGPLVLAEIYGYDGAGGGPIGATGYDLARGNTGDTDENMVRNVLQYVGLWCPGTTGAPASLDFEVHIGDADGTHPTTYPNSGTGQNLGAGPAGSPNGSQFIWTTGEKALAYIQKLDGISCPDLNRYGYRTYETRLGTIIRTNVSTFKASSAIAQFYEGVDIFDASGQQTALDIKNRISVTGYTPAGANQTPANMTLQAVNPLLRGFQPYNITNPMVERSKLTDAGTGISAQAVASYFLEQYNRELYKYTVTTPRDDIIQPGQTIGIFPNPGAGSNPGRLFGSGDYGLYYVQNVQTSIDPQGAFMQTLIVLGGPGGGVAEVPPGIDFTMSLDVENIVVSGTTETPLYTIHCVAQRIAGNAAISSYAWSTTGTCTPASGTQDTFTTSFTSFSGVTITLTVTDANGQTGATTHTPPAPNGTNYLIRSLYLAGTNTIDDYTGAAPPWNTASGVAATVVANAPLWGDGVNAKGSTNDLATAPSSAAAFPSSGASVTALWVETNANPNLCLAGGSGGHMSVSKNGGNSWTELTAVPDGLTVVRVLISAAVKNQYFALTGSHLYRSDNAGSGWVIVTSALAGETFNDISFAPARIMIAISGGSRFLVDLAGNVQSFSGGLGGNMVAVVADIRADRFYAYSSVQQTYAHANAGDTTLVRQADLPQPAITRGLWRDGTNRGMLYIAAGTAGVYKSLDGFATSAGYNQLRKPGVGSSPGGANYRQIGANGLLVQSPVVVTTVVIESSALLAKAITLWNGSTNNAPPASWYATGFTDSGWPAGVQAFVSGNTPHYQDNNIWTSGAPASTTERILVRQHFTVPTGTIGTVLMQWAIDDNVIGIWINGVLVPGGQSTGAGSYHCNVAPSLLVVGDNVFASEVANTGGSEAHYYYQIRLN